eukprot:jgi/Picre1/31301/NNA_006654.t1
MLASVSRAARRAYPEVQACFRTVSSTQAAMNTSLRPDEEMHAIDESSKGPSGVLEVPRRFLMGPGPANADPRVLNAQALPLLGHMHPPFLKIMDEIQEGLRYLFQTKSPYTLCVSGTGHAGMEACIANLVEPGETVIVGNKGIWGERVCDMAGRFGANVVELKKEAGKTFSFDELKAAVEKEKPAVLFLCQGESSLECNRVLQGLVICAKRMALCSCGSQKCLSAPPGAAPLFLSQRALDKIKSRKTKVRSYYLDMNLVGDYWGWYGSRSYHHTGMVSMWYSMREALALVAEEGLDAMWKRHQSVHEQLWAGLSEMGLKPFVEDPKDRLCTVNTIKVPEGVDWAAVCKNAMDKYEVEIAGGLGPSAGKVWRIGLMGYNATPATVELVLAAFKDGLTKQGYLPK